MNGKLFMFDRAIVGTINFVVGAGLSGSELIMNLDTGMSILTKLLGIIFLAVSIWQMYQAGLLKKRQRKSMSNNEDKNGDIKGHSREDK